MSVNDHQYISEEEVKAENNDNIKSSSLDFQEG